LVASKRPHFIGEKGGAESSTPVDSGEPEKNQKAVSSDQKGGTRVFFTPKLRTGTGPGGKGTKPGAACPVDKGGEKV